MKQMILKLANKIPLFNIMRKNNNLNPINLKDIFVYTLPKPYDLHKLDNGPPVQINCTKAEALDYYREMQTIRILENTASHLYYSKEVRGFCHLSLGQEAICVGVKSALSLNDSLITGYRCHGWAFEMGASLIGVLAELTGRQTGCSKGKGGSMHLYCKNFFGGQGIVGAQVPLGAGIALKFKCMNEPNICVVVYGDGAANQGQVYESFNMAKLWGLPVVFICENNFFGMGTSVSRASANTDFYTRGDFVPGVRVDGMDVLAVKEASKFARDYALNNGPIILEMVTYRYAGHSMSDPGTSYRQREEVQEVRKEKDPINSFAAQLVKHEIFTQDELHEIDEILKKNIKEAENRALSDPELDVTELYHHVYCDMEDGFKIRGCDNFSGHIHKKTEIKF